MSARYVLSTAAQIEKQIKIEEPLGGAGLKLGGSRIKCAGV